MCLHSENTLGVLGYLYYLILFHNSLHYHLTFKSLFINAQKNFITKEYIYIKNMTNVIKKGTTLIEEVKKSYARKESIQEMESL